MRLAQMLIWVTLVAVGQVAAEPLNTCDWLVDLERDYRLSSSTSGSDIDDEMCLLLVQAACRLDNAPPEAWRSQARMLDLLGHPETARQTLSRYLSLAPDDLRARLWYLSMSTELLQTTEARGAFFSEQLKQPSLPPPLSGELHRLLAEHHWTRNEKAPAAEQARAAMRDDRFNLQSRQLLAEIEGKSDTPQARIEFELVQVELNPGRLEWILALADDLMAVGLPDEAITWYRHAIALIESHPDSKAPPPLLMSLAWALIEQGTRELQPPPRQTQPATPGMASSLPQPSQYADAWKLTEQALAQDRDQTEPYRARVWIAGLRGDAQLESDQTKIARNIWFKFIDHDENGQPQERSEIEVDGRVQIKLWPAEVMANFAWFLAHDAVKAGAFELPGRVKDERSGAVYTGKWTLDPLQQAERTADVARGRDPESILAKRVLGSVRRQRGDFGEAESRLREIADQDVWAEIELAQLLEATGRREEADQGLIAAAQKATTAELRLTIGQIWNGWRSKRPSTRPASQPATRPWLKPASPSAVAGIQAAAKAFPQALLDFPFHPEKYLALQARLISGSPRVGEPWRCEFGVKNIGGFAIPIGPGLMLEPDLLCLVTLRGDRERGETISVPLDRLVQLAPGQSFTITRTLDVGRVRAGLIGTPQVSYDVTVEALVNPIAYSTSPDEPPQWQPGIGGIKIKPLRLRREPFKVDRDSIRGLLTQVKAPSAGTRITAMEILASLLAESQHLAAGRLRYAAQPIDPAVVQAAVLAQAADQDWQVRARLAECMRWFVLDSAATQQAVKLLNDPHWLVRGLAMRAMAEHQGTRSQSVLQVVSKQDPDEWVRNLSKTLLARLTAAAASVQTQPATPPAPGAPAQSPR